jgi:hypothetical protein
MSLDYELGAPSVETISHAATSELSSPSCARGAHSTIQPDARGARSLSQEIEHVQFIRAEDKTRVLAKQYTFDGERYSGGKAGRFPYHVVPYTAPVNDLAGFMDAVYEASKDPHTAMLSGAVNTADARVSRRFKEQGHLRRTSREEGDKLPNFIPKPRRFHMADFDPTPAQQARCRELGLDVIADKDHAVRTCVEEFFPDELKRVSYGYQLSAGCGIGSDGLLDGSRIKFHLFFELSKPLKPRVIKAWIRDHNRTQISLGYVKKGKNGHVQAGLDEALYQPVQPHFIAAPIFEGGTDPIRERWGYVQGERETLDLRVETIEIPEVIETKRRTIQRTRTERALVGTETYVPLDRNREWPRAWRECLSLIGPEGFHTPIRQTTLALAKELIARYGSDIPGDVLQPCLAEIEQAADKAPRGGRSLVTIESRKRDIRRMFDDAIPLVLSYRARQAARRSQKIAPHYPDTRVSLAEGEVRLSTLVADFITNAQAFATARQNQQSAIAAWEVAGRPEPTSRTTFPYPIFPATPPQTILAAETGLGKSREILQALLLCGVLWTHRVYLFVPTHEKQKEAAEEFLALATEIGLEAPPHSVFVGLNKACHAEPARKAAALAIAKHGISPRRSVCAGCPLLKTCAHAAQYSDRGPGLKICVKAHIGTHIPGLSGDPQEDDAPVLGFVIDEDYTDALDRQTVLELSRLPQPDDALSLVGALDAHQRSQRDAPWLREALSTVRQAAANPAQDGRLQRIHFAGWLENLWFGDEGYRIKVDYFLHEILEPLIQAHNDAANKAIGDALETGEQLDVSALLAPALSLRAVHEVFSLIRSNSGKECIAGTDVRGTGDATRLRLGWRQRLPLSLRCAPVLVLDATAHNEISRLPFAMRDELNGDEVAGDVALHRIAVKAPHATLIKVTDAPIAKHRFDRAALKLDDDGVKRPNRMRRDAGWAGIYRVANAFTGRALSCGGSAGFISFMGADDYADDVPVLPEGVLRGHFGALRGLNKWKDVDVLVVAGRWRMPMDAMERKAESIYALDPQGREVMRGAGDIRPMCGARVAGQIDGAPIEIEHPVCPLVRSVFEHDAIAEDVQALGRARAVRRTADTPVTILSLNNIVADVTYDAVVDWEALGSLSDLGAVAYAHGVVPLKPADLKSLAPGLFPEGRRGVEVMRELLKASGWCATESPPWAFGSLGCVGGVTNSAEKYPRKVGEPLFRDLSKEDNPPFRTNFPPEFVTPHLPRSELRAGSYQTTPRSKRRPCVYDPTRVEDAAKLLQTALGGPVRLFAADGTLLNTTLAPERKKRGRPHRERATASKAASKKRGRKPSANPSAAAARKRAQRERAAGKAAASTAADQPQPRKATCMQQIQKAPAHLPKLRLGFYGPVSRGTGPAPLRPISLVGDGRERLAGYPIRVLRRGVCSAQVARRSECRE